MPARVASLFWLLLIPILATAQVAEQEPILELEGEGLGVVGTVELNQQVVTLDKQQITQAQAPDLPTLLNQTLGLALVRNGGYGNQSAVSLRGFGSGRVAILVDGVPVNSAQSGDFDLSRIQISSLEKIEVISGGSDTKYNVNGAIGGVINLITVHQPDPGLQWGGSLSNQTFYPSAAGSSYLDTQAANVHAAGATDREFWSLDLTAHQAANRYPFLDEKDQVRLWSGNAVSDAGLAGTLGLNFAEDRRLLVSANGYLGSKDIHGTVNSATGGHQNEVNTRTSVVWSDGSVGSDALGTNLTLSHRLTSLDWTDPATHGVHHLNTWGLINRWDWTVASGLSLQAGGDLDESLLVSNTVGTLSDASGGVYATAQVTVADRWDLIPSVKLVAAQGLDALIPVPKLGLVYRVAEGWSLKNNYFRTFKLPTLNDRYWPEDSTSRGNPHLLPEDGMGADLIVEGRVRGAFSFQSSWYANRHVNAISWQPVAGKWTPQNIGQAIYAGTGEAFQTECFGPLGLRFTYEFLMTWVLTDALTFADNKRMPYKPVHTAGFGADYRWGSGSVRLDGHAESERFLSALNLTSLAPFFTLDLTADQQLGADLTLFCTLKNLLNQSYSTIDGYPMPGGSLTLGVRYEASAKSSSRTTERGMP